MGLNKRTYVNGETVITAENLNDIQDELIRQGEQQDATMIENSASGTIASFSDGANLPVSELLVGIEAVQSGSGDPSPENVRPISGWTGANIVVSPTLDAQDGTTYSISWQSEAGTVYGGTLNVTTGVLTVTHGYIASYNNETLSSKWISDRDVYASGTTPTIGAEVVYELATSQTVQLTSTEVLTLLGENNIFADCGDIENVTYRADTKLYIDNAIGGVDELLGSGVIE